MFQRRTSIVDVGRNALKKSANAVRIFAEIEGLDKRAIYSKELARFPELKGVIPATKIEQYYNQKKTYYVNIGTHGFYLLGSKNPLKLS